MLSSPIVIHVLRPYANEDEYLAHEHWSIDARSMLLIDQPELPIDTAVVFDVQLANGQKPIRAEATVVARFAAEGADPGGLRVRFKRFGAATKAFIDRAVQWASAPQGASRPTSLLLPSAAPSLSPEARPSLAPAAPSCAASVLDALPELALRVHPVLQGAKETSGVHRKLVSLVAAPPNREALLARLRGRKAG